VNWIKETLLSFLQRVRDRWELLPPEDQKRYKIIGGVIVALLFLLIFSPFLRARIETRSRLSDLRNQFQEAVKIEEELYARGIVPREGKTRGLERSLLGTMEQFARRAEISAKISSMRPIQKGSTDKEGIEVEVHDLVLEQVIRFLYLVEGEGKLLVSRLEIGKEVRNPSRLKLNIEVLAP
jgi:type II secretory pathway component PulM